MSRSCKHNPCASGQFLTKLWRHQKTLYWNDQKSWIFFYKVFIHWLIITIEICRSLTKLVSQFFFCYNQVNIKTKSCINSSLSQNDTKQKQLKNSEKEQRLKCTHYVRLRRMCHMTIKARKNWNDQSIWFVTENVPANRQKLKVSTPPSFPEGPIVTLIKLAWNNIIGEGGGVSTWG